MNDILTAFFENLGFQEVQYVPGISAWEKRFPNTEKHIVVSDKLEWDKLPSLEDGSFCVSCYLDNEMNATVPFMSGELYFEDAEKNADQVLPLLREIIMTVERKLIGA